MIENSIERNLETRNFSEILDSPEFKAKLDKAVADFSVSHQDLAEQKSAEWRCVEISWEFIEFLHNEGVIQPEMISDGLVGVAHIKIQNISHTVSKIGNTGIDWTRRQFEPESPFPFIFSILD